MNYLLGIDLGGSSVKAVTVTPEGHNLSRYTETFDPGVAMEFAHAVRAVAQRAQDDQGLPPQRIGFSAPGLASNDERSIAYLPNRLAGIEGFNWTTFLGAPRPVPVLNDAHAALLGEVWLGAAQGARNVVLLTLGTGVGGAAMVDGHLLRGAIGRAGHLGHVVVDMAGPPDICGTPGSLEWAFGNYSIAERSMGRFTTTHDLVSACKAGDSVAREIWLKSVRALACGVTSFINVLDPEIVILGGGIARTGELLFKSLAEQLDSIEWRPGGHRAQIVPAKMGEYAGAFGAAYNALSGSE